MILLKKQLFRREFSAGIKYITLKAGEKTLEERDKSDFKHRS